MLEPVDALLLDLLEWIELRPRLYSEAIEVWRTSCPRLPVWEEAHIRGFLEQRRESGSGVAVSLTRSGAAYLHQQRLAR